jgi:hypothetical protein
MPGHDGRIAPPGEFIGDRFAIGSDESRGTGIGQHRSVGRNIGVAPLPQLQTAGLYDWAVELGRCDA